MVGLPLIIHMALTCLQHLCNLWT